MATEVVHSRHHIDREVAGTNEERGGQVVHHTVGRKEKEGRISSRIVESVGCCIDSNWVGKGHNNSSIWGICEGTWGPNIAFAWARSRGKRGRCRHTNCVNIVEALAPNRAIRVTQEGQGIEVVYWLDHPNWGWAAKHRWDSVWCYLWGSPKFHEGEPYFVGGP